MSRVALVAGATGLVGSNLVNQLLANPHYDEVKVVGRRSSSLTHPKLRQLTVDFERLEETAGKALRGDVLFCCLGTTLKKAGSKEAFYRVDFTYCLELARLAARNGVNKLLYISSMGADPRSPAFYFRVKGEIEAALSKLPFAEVHLLRPSLLLGQREESRALEVFAQRLTSPLADVLARRPLGSLVSRYAPIRAAAVARAMALIALRDSPGIHVHLSDALQKGL